MKIAIPTDDGFTIDESFESAKGFLVTTFESGQIRKQELRKQLKATAALSAAISDQTLADCDTFIVRNIEAQQLKNLELQNKVVIKTKGILIAEELMSYIHYIAQKESDTCCCP